MTANSKIEWTDSTFNPWLGCTKVSPGCDHCYAEALADRRLHSVKWGPGQARRRTSAAYWREPLWWEREHEAFMAQNGRRRRVFCASLADVFDNEAPPAWRAELFALIGLTPHLDWLLLTKRIGNVPKMLEQPGMPKDGLPPNVWLGITVVNQAEADRDIPKLLAVSAAKRFLSMEPLLGPVNVSQWLRPRQRPNADGYGGDHGPGWTTDFTSIDWVIVGGESGPNARPMHPEWVRSLRDQCVAAGVPFHFKQWGEWAPADVITGGDLGGELERGTVMHLHAPGNPEGYFRRGDAYVRRMGKKRAGRMLGGREWDEVPK